MEDKRKDELLQEISKASRARHVTLGYWAYDGTLESATFSQGFDWEIVEAAQQDALALARIPLPRLRRLRIFHQQGRSPLDLNPLLDLLSKFTNPTWLDYDAHAPRGHPAPTNGNRHPVVLPNLQAICYKIENAFEFSYSHLIFPSLQYLSLYIYKYPSQVPLIDLVSRYYRILRSFAVRVWKTRGDAPIES
jgi:hypothetical protein